MISRYNFKYDKWNIGVQVTIFYQKLTLTLRIYIKDSCLCQGPRTFTQQKSRLAPQPPPHLWRRPQGQHPSSSFATPLHPHLPHGHQDLDGAQVRRMPLGAPKHIRLLDFVVNHTMPPPDAATLAFPTATKTVPPSPASPTAPKTLATASQPAPQAPTPDAANSAMTVPKHGPGRPKKNTIQATATTTQTSDAPSHAEPCGVTKRRLHAVVGRTIKHVSIKLTLYFS